MKIYLSIDYNTQFGQSLHVCGSIPELGNWNEAIAREMVYVSPSRWELVLDIETDSPIEYRYLVKEYGNVVRRESCDSHLLLASSSKIFRINDSWGNPPDHKFLYTSAFTDSFLLRDYAEKINYYNRSILFRVRCPFVKKNQVLIISGQSDTLGQWQYKETLELLPVDAREWQIAIDASEVQTPLEYKFAIYDKRQNKIVHWEHGENRLLTPVAIDNNTVITETLEYKNETISWKAAGVAIPVFSLRSNDSFGIGEFSDLKKMVDWAAITEQKVIQILPINDTTTTYTWLDSYPYNANSIYALHPIYLGLKSFPLNDANRNEYYRQEASQLNALSEVDYEKVLQLKWSYLRELFEELGESILKSEGYQSFYFQNEYWLFPYACFSYLRDEHKTANYSHWGKYSDYNKENLFQWVSTDKDVKKAIDLLFFVQYLLHIQLSEVKEYAHQNGVVLKGDIPIGINRHSVEAWTEPHLFNLDVQTGAPPDDFSVSGQNWGFPTYNWAEMAKDGYQWWIKRFRKMADYFDAYRIDHILGFFRIWEIPTSSVEGLLGYFSPALPLSINEIERAGIKFDEYRMTKPYIHADYLEDIFGDCTSEVIDAYLHYTGSQLYELNTECATQRQIKELFTDRNDPKNEKIRDGLFSLCNQVLFVRDKSEPHKFHPRIVAQQTYSFKSLDDASKAAFSSVYDQFFFYRHSQYWADQAMAKLPILISSTQMLVCGEDLGMIPTCVPSVMKELQILSLEIERMPKTFGQLFENLSSLPYMSVCTTSSHDISPLRLWWQEDREKTQLYYNDVLWKQGEAPFDCTSDLCQQILINHLGSPAMLTILPLQDWLSINDKLKRPNPEEERINVPSIPNHYWRYRMHLTLEELIESDEINSQIKSMIESTGR